jgi:hypothetical protein
MRSKSIFAIAVIAAVLAAIPVYAHHSFSSEYDSAKRLSLKGKMIAFEFVNPHSWIHIEVTNPDGTKTLWKGETPPANALYRYGWTKPMAEEMVKKGEIVTLVGTAAKDGSNHVFANSVTRGDGATVLGFGPPPEN